MHTCNQSQNKGGRERNGKIPEIHCPKREGNWPPEKQFLRLTSTCTCTLTTTNTPAPKKGEEGRQVKGVMERGQTTSTPAQWQADTRNIITQVTEGRLSQARVSLVCVANCRPARIKTVSKDGAGWAEIPRLNFEEINILMGRNQDRTSRSLTDTNAWGQGIWRQGDTQWRLLQRRHTKWPQQTLPWTWMIFLKNVLGR